LESHTRLAQDT
jgi:hypothetical protein